METQNHTAILSGYLAGMGAESYRQNSSRSKLGLLQDGGRRRAAGNRGHDDDLVVGANCVTLH